MEILNFFIDSKEQNYMGLMQKKNDLTYLLQHLKIQSKVIQELEELLEETNNLIAFYSSNRESNTIYFIFLINFLKMLNFFNLLNLRYFFEKTTQRISKCFKNFIEKKTISSLKFNF